MRAFVMRCDVVQNVTSVNVRANVFACVRARVCACVCVSVCAFNTSRMFTPIESLPVSQPGPRDVQRKMILVQMICLGWCFFPFHFIF